jgi:2,3-bisphosphoglycerate-dependent phosphoglycerate mutase
MNVGLTEKGRASAHTAGELLKAAGIRIDVAFTSHLSRAQDTLTGALGAMGLTQRVVSEADVTYAVRVQQGVAWRETNTIPVVQSQLLNERHYGALAGLGREEFMAMLPGLLRPLSGPSGG